MRYIGGMTLPPNSRDFGKTPAGRIGLLIVLLCGAVPQTSCGWMSRVHNKETVSFADDLRETRQEITGRATIKDFPSDHPVVEIHGDKQARNGIFWPAFAPNPATLDASVPWHFELLEYTNRRISLTDILRVRLRRQVVFDASVCEVHHDPMTRVVEVTDKYAGRKSPDFFAETRSTRFPHTGTGFPVCQFYDNFWVTWRCSKCVDEGKVWCCRHLARAPFL